MQFRTVSIAAAVDLYFQVADFFAQRIPVETQKVSRPDLIASRSGQRRREQRHLDFLENPVVEPRRRNAIRKARKVGRQVSLDGPTEVVDAVVRVAA